MPAWNFEKGTGMTKTVVEGNYLRHPATEEMETESRKQGEWSSAEKMMKSRNIQR